MAEDLKSRIIKLALQGDLEQGLKLAGDDVTLLYDIGAYFYKLKKLEIALIFFRRILEVDPKNSSAHNYLGILLSNLKRYEEAEREYREAIGLWPELGGYHNNLGVLLKELKRYEEAEREHKEAIRLQPEVAGFHNNLGILLTERGDLISDEIFYAEAMDEFKKALGLGLEDTKLHNNLGYTYVKLGDYNKAREEFTKALKLDPVYYKARRNLKRIDKTTKEKVPTWLKVILSLIIVSELGFSYYTFWNTDKLGGSNFAAIILVLTGFLALIILYPELRKFKVGPQGIEFEKGEKGEWAESLKMER